MSRRRNSSGGWRSRNINLPPFSLSRGFALIILRIVHVGKDGFIIHFHLVDLLGMGADQAAQADSVILLLNFIAVLGVEEDGMAAAAAIGGDDDTGMSGFKELDHVGN